MKKIPYGYSAADLHIHTKSSDGVMSPYAVINDIIFRNLIMKKTGIGLLLSVVAITDHDNIDGSLIAKEYYDETYEDKELEIITGSEISSSDGHILALNISENIMPGMTASETIDAIHRQGGLAVAAHPYSYLPFLKDFKGVGKLIYDRKTGPKFDAVEIRNSNPTEIINNLITQIVNNKHFRHPVTGSSDSHFQSAIGKSFTVFPGRTAKDLFNAIRENKTIAFGYVYGPVSIFRYFRDRLKWRNFCKEDPVNRLYHQW